jgi:hypothetical protein
MGFAILFPLVLGEVFKSLFFEQPIDPAGLWMYLVLSIAFLVVVYTRKMELQGKY